MWNFHNANSGVVAGSKAGCTEFQAESQTQLKLYLNEDRSWWTAGHEQTETKYSQKYSANPVLFGSTRN